MKQCQQVWVALLVGALATQGCGAEKATGPKAAGLEITVEPSALAETMEPLVVQPVVQALDASGNAVAISGIVVSALVASGNGDVRDGGTATTDAQGVATFEDLTLGALAGQVGAVTLQFASPGLTSANAASTTTLSCSIETISLGAIIARSLVNGDCLRTTGQKQKLYEVDVALPIKALRIADTAAFQPLVIARGPNEPVRFLGVGAQEGSTGLSFRVLVPPGITRILATSVPPGVSGAFSLRVLAAPEDEAICEASQWQSPVSVTQTLATNCADEAGNVGDFFVFVLSVGASVTTSATTSAFTPYIAIWLYSPNERQVFQTDVGNTATVTWTNSLTTPQIYYVFVGSNTGTGIGTYTLTASITNPTGPTPARDVAPLSVIPLSLQTGALGGGRGRK